MKMTVAQAAQAVRTYGDIDVFADVPVTGLAIDSRAVKPGDIFCCLPGQNFDGHAFAEKAVENGASAVLASRPLPELDGKTAVLLAPDVEAAMGLLASAWRCETKAKVVCVTGSVGKTTVKEMLAAILGDCGKTAKNYKNFNNLLGVPLTICNTDGDEDFWVLEIGISLQGEMDVLASITRPDAAVINTVGPVHLEGLGSMEGVISAKTDLLKYIAPGGFAVVNKDIDDLYTAALNKHPMVRGFSVHAGKADFTCAYKGVSDAGHGLYDLVLHKEAFQVETSVTGAFQAENVAAAATTAFLLGATPEQIATGLSKFSTPDGRFHSVEAGGFTLVDDTYNANPLSMAGALERAAELAQGRPLIFVTGDMLELGEGEEAAHRELGRQMAEQEPAAVFHRGRYFDAVTLGMGNGKAEAPVLHAREAEDFMKAFQGLGLGEGFVLFKGSRSLKMEELYEALRKELQKEHPDAMRPEHSA